MSKGIIRVTPRVGTTTPGTLEVTVADSNTWGVRVTNMLSFADPGFAVAVGQTADTTFLSATTCKVNKIIAPNG